MGEVQKRTQQLESDRGPAVMGSGPSPLAQLPAVPALTDQVHDRLLHAIVDGTLPAGERLTQDSVATLLGVSRQPVSHALLVLRRRGLLIEAGKRGLAVAPSWSDNGSNSWSRLVNKPSSNGKMRNSRSNKCKPNGTKWLIKPKPGSNSSSN